MVNFVNRCKQKNDPVPVNDICASFQEAVVEVLVEKTIRAAKKAGHTRIVAGGGVAANNALRKALKKRCHREGFACFLPSPVLCTDNAAMIGLAGYYQFAEGNTLSPDADAFSRSPLN